MSVIVTPNMNLPVPVVDQELGPTYAIDINNCLVLLDQHTHQPGAGIQITPAGLNINSDLTFTGNRGLLFKSATFSPQGSPLAAVTPDLGALYVAGVDLYYNDINGNQIRFTQNGSIVGAGGTITGLVAPASASYVAGSSSFVWQSDANTSAGMDGGPVTIRNIVANSFGTTISANPSLAADYDITLPAAPPATTQLLSMDNAGNIIANTDPTSLFFPGFMGEYGGATAPTGWLICDGTAKSRTTYANLFAAIGTNFGVGDGTTTFNLPPSGVVYRSVDGGSGNDPDASSRSAINGGNSGDNVGSFQASQVGPHAHGLTVFYPPTGDNLGVAIIPQGMSNSAGPSLTAAGIGTNNSGGNQTNTVNVYITKIIKT